MTRASHSASTAAPSPSAGETLTPVVQGILPSSGDGGTIIGELARKRLGEVTAILDEMTSAAPRLERALVEILSVSKEAREWFELLSLEEGDSPLSKGKALAIKSQLLSQVGELDTNLTRALDRLREALTGIVPVDELSRLLGQGPDEIADYVLPLWLVGQQRSWRVEVEELVAERFLELTKYRDGTAILHSITDGKDAGIERALRASVGADPSEIPLRSSLHLGAVAEILSLKEPLAASFFHEELRRAVDYFTMARSRSAEIRALLGDVTVAEARIIDPQRSGEVSTSDRWIDLVSRLGSSAASSGAVTGDRIRSVLCGLIPEDTVTHLADLGPSGELRTVLRDLDFAFNDRRALIAARAAFLHRLRALSAHPDAQGELPALVDSRDSGVRAWTLDVIGELRISNELLDEESFTGTRAGSRHLYGVGKSKEGVEKIRRPSIDTPSGLLVLIEQVGSALSYGRYQTKEFTRIIRTMESKDTLASLPADEIIPALIDLLTAVQLGRSVRERVGSFESESHDLLALAIANLRRGQPRLTEPGGWVAGLVSNIQISDDVQAKVPAAEPSLSRDGLEVVLERATRTRQAVDEKMRFSIVTAIGKALSRPSDPDLELAERFKSMGSGLRPALATLLWLVGRSQERDVSGAFFGALMVLSEHNSRNSEILSDPRRMARLILREVVIPRARNEVTKHAGAEVMSALTNYRRFMSQVVGARQTIPAGLEYAAPLAKTIHREDFEVRCDEVMSLLERGALDELGGDAASLEPDLVLSAGFNERVIPNDELPSITSASGTLLAINRALGGERIDTALLKIAASQISSGVKGTPIAGELFLAKLLDARRRLGDDVGTLHHAAMVEEAIAAVARRDVSDLGVPFRILGQSIDGCPVVDDAHLVRRPGTRDSLTALFSRYLELTHTIKAAVEDGDKKRADGAQQERAWLSKVLVGSIDVADFKGKLPSTQVAPLDIITVSLNLSSESHEPHVQERVARALLSLAQQRPSFRREMLSLLQPEGASLPETRLGRHLRELNPRIDLAMSLRGLCGAVLSVAGSASGEESTNALVAKEFLCAAGLHPEVLSVMLDKDTGRPKTAESSLAAEVIESLVRVHGADELGRLLPEGASRARYVRVLQTRERVTQLFVAPRFPEPPREGDSALAEFEGIISVVDAPSIGGIPQSPSFKSILLSNQTPSGTFGSSRSISLGADSSKKWSAYRHSVFPPLTQELIERTQSLRIGGSLAPAEQTKLAETLSAIRRLVSERHGLKRTNMNVNVFVIVDALTDGSNLSDSLCREMKDTLHAMIQRSSTVEIKGPSGTWDHSSPMKHMVWLAAGSFVDRRYAETARAVLSEIAPQIDFSARGVWNKEGYKPLEYGWLFYLAHNSADFGEKCNYMAAAFRVLAGRSSDMTNLIEANLESTIWSGFRSAHEGWLSQKYDGAIERSAGRPLQQRYLAAVRDIAVGRCVKDTVLCSLEIAGGSRSYDRCTRAAAQHFLNAVARDARIRDYLEEAARKGTREQAAIAKSILCETKQAASPVDRRDKGRVNVHGKGTPPLPPTRDGEPQQLSFEQYLDHDDAHAPYDPFMDI